MQLNPITRFKYYLLPPLVGLLSILLSSSLLKIQSCFTNSALFLPFKFTCSLKDNGLNPLHIGGGPITRAKAKRMKEALNGLIEDVWAKQMTIETDLGLERSTRLITLVQALNGPNQLFT